MKDEEKLKYSIFAYIKSDMLMFFFLLR